MKFGYPAPLPHEQFADEVFRHIPGVRDIADVDFFSSFSMDSSNLSPEHWVTLGRIIWDNMDAYDGFVIIHGTDTMSYTASALSYMLSNLAKPVILTGSQRPLSAIRTDAKNNLINAIELATYPIPEVCVFFDYKLFRGNRSKKISIDEFDAFVSPNFGTLADVGLHIEIHENLLRSPSGMLRFDTAFGRDVISIRLFPGMNAALLDGLAQTSAKVFILEAFGSGNVPTLENSVIPFIKKTTETGKMVAIASQCISGGIDLNLYDCGKEALMAGAVSCGDMTSEAAIIKAMYLLGQFDGHVGRVRSNFNTSIAGEITESDSNS